MSAVSASQGDHGAFWEFATCGRCQMPFMSPTGATIPFWLTECGHLVCNNHLSVNQSCSICGSPGIQLVPLQREMEAPMSDWFQSVPISLDSIANAAKFQQETMASQIRHYRARHQQQRSLIERLKHDVEELKKLNVRLQGENDQFRQHLGNNPYSNGGFNKSISGREDILNSNGKRSRTSASSYQQHGARAMTSSPQSIATPLGSNRLTLPHDQPAPNLSPHHADNVQAVSLPTNPRQGPPASVTQNRPSSTFVEKYAYIPPSTPQFHLPQLNHDQLAPQMSKRTKPNIEMHQDRLQSHPPQTQTHRSMLPPPIPARFKAAHPSQAINKTSNQFSRQGYKTSGQQPQKTDDTSRQHHSSQSTQVRPITSTITSHHENGLNRFHPPTNHLPLTATGQLTTMPNNGPQRFIPAGSRAPSRAQRLDFGNGGQRMPFLIQ